MEKKYANKDLQQFYEDMKKAGNDVMENYHGRSMYAGPAVSISTSPEELQRIIRATSVILAWDDLGKGRVVYPKYRGEITR